MLWIYFNEFVIFIIIILFGGILYFVLEGFRMLFFYRLVVYSFV